nr:MAG TPA: hypothetical protein [Caudoviricetes sp.]
MNCGIPRLRKFRFFLNHWDRGGTSGMEKFWFFTCDGGVVLIFDK